MKIGNLQERSNNKYLKLKVELSPSEICCAICLIENPLKMM